jgi:hypothetical protein
MTLNNNNTEPTATPFEVKTVKTVKRVAAPFKRQSDFMNWLDAEIKVITVNHFLKNSNQ